MSTEHQTPPAVRMVGITKRFGSTLANDGVDLTLERGEIHAVLGENGAGKTTLMSILFGLVAPDAGEIWLGDRRSEISSPHDALQHGIGMVHQHFMLIPELTVAENVVLGTRGVFRAGLRRARIESEVRAAADRFQLEIDPAALAGDLPIELQQRVEILKLLFRGTDILILDEPTAVLGPAQIAALLAILEHLRDEGHSIVIITHKLAEVMAISDRVSVLNGGRQVFTAPRGAVDEGTLVSAMIGRELPEPPDRALRTPPRPTVRLSVDGVSTGAGDDKTIAFDVREGEIVGIVGVEGNGQRELYDGLTGGAANGRGNILIDGRPVPGHDPRDLIVAGVGAVPADRHGAGLVLDMSVAENLALADVPAGRFVRRGLLSGRLMRIHARRLIAEYDIRPTDPAVRAGALSGGNQQKVVLARELSRRPAVLVVSSPTQGLDVGATADVHQRLLTAREAGAAIVLISYDLDELLALADRLVVLHRGRIVLESATADADIGQLGLAMAGSGG